MLWAGHPCQTHYPWPRDTNCTTELIDTMLSKLAPLNDVVDSVAIVQSYYVADPANASMPGFGAGLIRQPHLNKVVSAYKQAGWTVEAVIGDIDPTITRPGRIQQARMKIENYRPYLQKGRMRDAFVAACADEVQTLGLAGLNFDFEFPECGNPSTMPPGVPPCSAAGMQPTSPGFWPMSKLHSNSKQKD